MLLPMVFGIMNMRTLIYHQQGGISRNVYSSVMGFELYAVHQYYTCVIRFLFEMADNKTH
jgi:hypothetical protein